MGRSFRVPPESVVDLCLHRHSLLCRTPEKTFPQETACPVGSWAPQGAPSWTTQQVELQNPCTSSAEAVHGLIALSWGSGKFSALLRYYDSSSVRVLGCSDSKILSFFFFYKSYKKQKKTKTKKNFLQSVDLTCKYSMGYSVGLFIKHSKGEINKVGGISYAGQWEKKRCLVWATWPQCRVIIPLLRSLYYENYLIK